MDDVRYSELRFLQMLASGSSDLQLFYDQNGERSRAIGLNPNMYVDMAATLIEELQVQFHDQEPQWIVGRLRGEISPNSNLRGHFPPHNWDNPREALYGFLRGHKGVQSLRITYRGLRRIEELRDLLRNDRILEHFGILLDLRYLRRDLEDALQRASDVTVSLLYADMDDFKPINTESCHAAGDVVMKAYLEVVRDSLGSFGTGYRGKGDEVVGLAIGQGHKRAVEIAETIRKRVEAMQCEYKGKLLRKVTASIGVATTPPESRSLDIEMVAENRNRQAKERGKNRVVAD